MAMQIGIDLGNRAIKVVQGRTKGSLFEVQRAFLVPVEPSEDQESAILSSLDQVFAELGKKTPGARFSVSGRELIFRYTKVPPVPLWRLKLLMEFEVREMADQAGEALASDYNLVQMPDAGDEDETVMVAVVKEPHLMARHAAIASQIGEPAGATPAAIALFNAYQQSGELHDGETVMLVDLGERNTEIAIQRDGELFFARNLAIGGALLTESVQRTLSLDRARAERAKEEHGNVTPRGRAQYASGQEERVANALIGPVGQLAAMLQSGLAFARAQAGKPSMQLGRILLTGGGAALRGLPEALQATFNCPVERFQPSAGLDLKAPADEAALFETDPGRFAVALGLAASVQHPKAFQLDIVPAAVHKKREFLRGKLWTIAAAVIAVLFLVAHGVRSSGHAAELEREAKVLRSKAQRAKSERAEYEDQVTAIRAANRVAAELDDRPRAAVALATAQELVQRFRPSGVWIREVSIARERLETTDAAGKKKVIGRLLVRVEGLVFSTAQQASAALEKMKTSIMEERPEVMVKITRVEDARRPGVQQTEFALSIDPDAKSAAPEVTP